jgi:hypothetical protein
MFQRLDGGVIAVRLHGAAGAILWGYHQAATFTAWTIKRRPNGTWRLNATCARVDAFQCRQRPLLFSAMREHGFWAWGVESDLEIVGLQLTATLGPPEQ